MSKVAHVLASMLGGKSELWGPPSARYARDRKEERVQGDPRGPGGPPHGHHPSFYIFLLLVAIGIARIALPYRWVAQTVDETPTIACGMQWLGSRRRRVR